MRSRHGWLGIRIAAACSGGDPVAGKSLKGGVEGSALAHPALTQCRQHPVAAEVLRRPRWIVYYGEGTRYDSMEAASTRIPVVGIDEHEKIV